MSALRLRYQTLEFPGLDIHLRTLRDKQQFDDHHGVAEALGISSATWPLFGVVWPGGRALADLMCGYDIAGKRILEVGCGIGLASLVLNHRDADITATDHHPQAGLFLEQNVALNGGKAIPFVRTDWADEGGGLGRFDLIIGSDILYERDHADLLSEFIDRHALPACAVVIVDPGRGHRGRFTKRMVALGYTHALLTLDESAESYEGQVMHYERVTGSPPPPA